MQNYKDIDKMVYISHDYDGKESNRNHTEQIIKGLTLKYPDIIFLSPISSLGPVYSLLNPNERTRHCLALLDRCDEMWRTDGFVYSELCDMEKEYSKAYKIHIRTIRRCEDSCEWNNKSHCDVGFCILPRCIKHHAK